MQAQAIAHRDEIIALAAQGTALSEIAQRIGIHPSGISQQLAKDPEYRIARETGAEMRLDDREKELEEAQPTIAAISRASQLLGHQRWRCEREFPARWGAKQEITHHGQQPALQVTIVQAALPEKIVPSEPLEHLAIASKA